MSTSSGIPPNNDDTLSNISTQRDSPTPSEVILTPPEEESDESDTGKRPFIIISMLGPPSAGKSTMCERLAKQYGFSTFSIDDFLHKQKQRIAFGELEAATWEANFDNEGYIKGEELQDCIRDDIEKAHNRNDRGIVIDGYPQRSSQVETKFGFNMWSFHIEHPWLFAENEKREIPDRVFYLDVDGDFARERYVEEMFDTESFRDKFDKRLDEFKNHSGALRHWYRQQGNLVEVNGNGTKEQVFELIDAEMQRSGWMKRPANEMEHRKENQKK